MSREITIQRTDNGFVSWGLDGVLCYRDPEGIEYRLIERNGVEWVLTAKVVKKTTE